MFTPPWERSYGYGWELDEFRRQKEIRRQLEELRRKLLFEKVMKEIKMKVNNNNPDALPDQKSR